MAPRAAAAACAPRPAAAARRCLVALAIAAAARGAAASATTACRDPFAWPFEAGSIWNTAIGSGAKYAPANIYATPADNPFGIHNDQEWLLDSRDPRTTTPVAWMDDGGNFPGGCSTTGPVRTTLPLPTNATTDCDANNNSAGVLLPNATLVQMQPLYRARAGGPFVAWYRRGAPQPFPWTNDVLGRDGLSALGSHGGSGLSGFGGSIRVGELTGDAPIAHALKLELWAARYYFNSSTQPGASCFTWPAVGCDSYAHAGPGVGYGGANPLLVPGALLAVPPAVAAALAPTVGTHPGRQLLAALTDYGGYLVDDTGSQRGGGAFCAEHAVNDEVAAAYVWSMSIGDPLTPTQGAPLYADVVSIFGALHVVANNGPASVGGGGVPRRPPPPPFC